MAATQRFVRGAVADAANRVHIQLRNVPRTALTVGHTRGLWCAGRLENVKKVEVNYRHFEPDGTGWITLASPTFMKHALESLEGATIAAFPIQARSSPPPLVASRTRGVQGRAEAANRGVITGDGPTAGITGNGRNVIVTGLPGRMGIEELKLWLKNFKLAGNTPGEKEIVKIESSDRQNGLSTHLIRLSSVSEAHRMVRRLHQTFYEQDTLGTRYPIRARIIH